MGEGASVAGNAHCPSDDSRPRGGIQGMVSGGINVIDLSVE